MQLHRFLLEQLPNSVLLMDLLTSEDLSADVREILDTWRVPLSVTTAIDIGSQCVCMVRNFVSPASGITVLVRCADSSNSSNSHRDQWLCPLVVYVAIASDTSIDQLRKKTIYGILKRDEHGQRTSSSSSNQTIADQLLSEDQVHQFIGSTASMTSVRLVRLQVAAFLPSGLVSVQTDCADLSLAQLSIGQLLIVLDQDMDSALLDMLQLNEQVESQERNGAVPVDDPLPLTLRDPITVDALSESLDNYLAQRKRMELTSDASLRLVERKIEAHARTLLLSIDSAEPSIELNERLVRALRTACDTIEGRRSTMMNDIESLKEVLQETQREVADLYGLAEDDGSDAADAVRRVPYRPADANWEMSEEQVLQHLKQRDEERMMQLEPEPAGVDAFLLSPLDSAVAGAIASQQHQHHHHHSADNPAIPVMSGPHSNVLSAKQIGIETRKGYDLVRVGNFAETPEGLQVSDHDDDIRLIAH